VTRRESGISRKEKVRFNTGFKSIATVRWAYRPLF